MNSYYDDILKQLRDGVPEEEIAQNFADALNTALDEMRGRSLYERARSDLRYAWNTAVDAYAVYKGMPKGMNESDLYLHENDDILEDIMPIFELIKGLSEDLSAVIPTWRDQIGSK